jgi:hypothetical protein
MVLRMSEIAHAIDYRQRSTGAGKTWARRRAAASRAIATAKAMLPLRYGRFERVLAAAVEEASTAKNGFYLADYPARRALGQRLVIDVDPTMIRYRLRHRMTVSNAPVNLHDKFLGAGDWADLLQPIADSSTHREVSEIVAMDMDYRRTQAYRVAVERAGGDNPVERNFVALKTPELVESYYRLTTDLCRSIEKHGVGRRSEYRGAVNLFKNPRVRLPWVELMESDVGVAVGPNGELYRFASGKHRTAAAQSMRLPSIPVEVRMVHETWLRRQMTDARMPVVNALIEGVRSLARK